MSNYSVFGAPPPEPRGFDADRVTEQFAGLVSRVTQASWSSRAALAVTLVLISLAIALITPLGVRGAWVFAGGGSAGDPAAAPPRTCAATFCNQPATGLVQYTSGEKVYYCSAHIDGAPQRKSLSWLVIISLPLTLVVVGLFVAGTAGPFLPLLLLARPPSRGAVTLALVSWIAAAPAAWLGALVWRVLRAMVG